MPRTSASWNLLSSYLLQFAEVAKNGSATSAFKGQCLDGSFLTGRLIIKFEAELLPCDVNL